MSEPIRWPFEYFFGCKRFAIWHRFFMPSTFKGVDIDYIGTEAGRVVYVVEATTSSPAGKNCSVTRKIAEALDARAYIVQIPRIERAAEDWLPWRQVADYMMAAEPPESIVVRLVYPLPGWQKRLSWDEFADELHRARQRAYP